MHLTQVKATLGQQILSDYQVYYGRYGLPTQLTALGTSGIMANTTVDKKLQHAWQEKIRSPFTDKLSQGVDYYSEFSQYKIILPFYVASLWVGGNYGIWGNHALRTLLVGAPQQALLTRLLGGGRPESQQPQWHFFRHHNSVSGHAFYGAIPLLNMACLTPNRELKTTLILLSLLPGLARINTDKHYASQALLGWWIAWNATRAVWQADIVSKKPNIWSYQFTPAPNAIYLGLNAKF